MGEREASEGGESRVRVWLDILTPKQANLFAELSARLTARGCKVLATTRHYREVNELLELRKLRSIEIGRHGGSRLTDKLVESSKRVAALTRIVEEYAPDAAISFSSPEAARVAFGLRLPHYCISDSPHAEAVCKLSIPLCQKLFTPWVIPKYAWKRYGISSRDIVRYHALDPIAWLKAWKKNPRILDDLNLDIKKPIIVIRTSEEFAAYLSNNSTAQISKTTEIVEKLLSMNGTHVQVVVLPRYDEQSDRLHKRFGSRVIVPQHVIDAISLLQASTVFIGGGGTMSAESALLGVPTVSYYPGEETFVEKFLINYGLIERILDPERIAHRAIAISRSREFQEFCLKKSSRLVDTMEDPLRVIIQHVLN
jgi:predicted glycosyltransferase